MQDALEYYFHTCLFRTTSYFYYKSKLQFMYRNLVISIPQITTFQLLRIILLQFNTYNTIFFLLFVTKIKLKQQISAQQVDMAMQRKFVDYFRSPKDKSIFHIFYPAPSNILMAKLISNVSISDFIKAGGHLGYIQQSQNHRSLIQAPVSGNVVDIRPIEALNVKGKMLHIFSIKQCQHFPKDKNQGYPENQILAQSNSILQTADVCMHCQQQIWSYYDKNQVQISYRQLKKSFEQFNVKEFQWKSCLNQQYTKDTQIGSTYDQSYHIPGSGKVTFLYQFSKNQPSPETIVLKYKNIICKHQKIASGICVFCLTDIKNMKGLNLRRYLFQFDQQKFTNNLFLSGKALQDKANQFKNKLINNKKGLLVLDLDNTILHSISLRRVSEDMIKQIQQYAIIPPQQNTSIFIEKTLVKFRPNFQYFLAKIVKYFEIFIYTKGTRAYAQQICRVVKSKYPHILQNSKNFMPHRIISRDEDPNFAKKNLQYLIPKNRQIILILDDRRDVWNHSPLCIFTRPYVFFYQVALTQDGKTKIQPVQWEKGGGTIQHKLNQFEEKCVKQIQQAEKLGKQQQAVQKITELKQQIQASQKNQQVNSNVVILPPEKNLKLNQQEQQNNEKHKQFKQSQNEQRLILIQQQKQIINQQQNIFENQQRKIQENKIQQNIQQGQKTLKQNQKTNFISNSQKVKTIENSINQIFKGTKENNTIKDKLTNKQQKNQKNYRVGNLNIQGRQKQLKNNSNVADQYLITTLFSLKQAHSIYFEKLLLKDDEHKKQGKYADLSVCFQEYKKKLLDHLSVYFVARDYKKLGSYRRSQKMGLKIVQNTCQAVDLIIRPNNLIQGYSQASQDKYYQMIVKKLKSLSQPKKIPIVSQIWIDVCYEYNCCIHHSYFEPNDPYAKQIFKTEGQIGLATGLATVSTANHIKKVLDTNDNGIQSNVYDDKQINN